MIILTIEVINNIVINCWCLMNKFFYQSLITNHQISALRDFNHLFILLSNQLGLQMKFSKMILIFPCLLLIISFSACCNCGNNLDENNTVKGFITVIGNEPFTKLAIRTDDNKTYVLQVSKELKDELWKKQGNYYYIKYGDLREEEGVSTLVVEKVIPLNKESK